MLPLLPHKLLRLAHRHLLADLGFLALILTSLSGCADLKAPMSTAAPAISLSTTALNFNTVVVGQTQSQTLHLSNSGAAPLRITDLSLSNKQFVISGPSVPRVVLPNMSLDYSISFTPTSAGVISASLQIASNATNAVAAVSLTGTGKKVVAAATVTPASVNFGTLTLQTTSTKNVTLQNSGDINITISGVTVAGAGFGYSNLSPGYSLSPNQSVTFQVWFRPTVNGPYSGTVSILSANLSSPESLALSGNGASSTPNPPPPPPPVQHTVHLTWNLSDIAVVGYRVYRSLSAGSGFQPVNGSLVSSGSYDDDTVASGKTYFYEVTSVDSSGIESNFSNEATAIVPTP